MRINSTVALTLVLLVLMVGAGVVSAVYGYSLGREALKGVKQPDVRPATVGENAPDSTEVKEFEIIPESQILEDVNTQMNRSSLPSSPWSAIA
ncbi:MAG: hypothetical protein AAFY26_11380 [Cyanobacteria bacterium J06638_22]